MFGSKVKYISFIALVFVLVLSVSVINAKEAKSDDTQKVAEEPKLTKPEGVRFLKNKEFDDSDKARKEILDLYKDLRLTDVLDGMDLIGLQDIGLMDKSIRPLWRDTDNFTHRIVGFAIT